MNEEERRRRRRNDEMKNGGKSHGAVKAVGGCYGNISAVGLEGASLYEVVNIICYD